MASETIIILLNTTSSAGVGKLCLSIIGVCKHYN